MMLLDADHLRQVLDARALGVWERQEGDLVLLRFCSAEDLSSEVALAFEHATCRVSLNSTELGIVVAAVTGEPRVSVASELSPDEGSGLWLRRFAADRSVAMPVVDEGLVTGVVSVALRDGERSDDEVIALLRGFLGSSD